MKTTIHLKRGIKLKRRNEMDIILLRDQLV